MSWTPVVRRAVGVGWLAMAGSGCIGMPKPLPAEYFVPARTISVRVVECIRTPTLRTDQPEGRIAGTTWVARQQAMVNRMRGITPDMIQLAVIREVERQLPPTFAIAGDGAQLNLEIAIKEWGWSVPTGQFGESLAGHAFRIGGTASILDPAKGNERVFFTYNGTDTPMGDHLTAEKCEATLPKAAADFAAQIVRYIRQGKPE
jgi:hypothetical protein